MIFDSIQEELNNAIIDLSDDLLKSFKLQEASIHHIKDHAKSKRFKFSDRQCLGNTMLRLPKEMGVYLIFHYESLAYVGYGRIANRINSFKQTLTNSKKTGHRGAVKARKDDPNVLNYEVACTVVPDETLAAKIETYFITDYSPKYCDPAQAGK